MPISIDKIPKDVKDLLKWKWEQRGFKISFPEFLSLYVYAYNKAEEYGFSDPETMVLELFDRIDPDLSYDELKSEIEAYLIPVRTAEFEELEFWKKRAQELEKELKKAVSPQVYEELKREYEKLKRKLEEREREIEEMKHGIREEIRERTKEFEELIKEYPTDELIASWYALKTRPEELSEEEWIVRREAIKRELERRKVPKSVTGDFLEPVTEWKGVRVPPELRFWYDPVERRFYRNGRPVTPETIDRAIEQLLKPIKIKKQPEIITPPPRYEQLDVPSLEESPPPMSSIRKYLKEVTGLILAETGKLPNQLSDEELERILTELEKSFPRQVYYFRWFIRHYPNWRRFGVF